MTLPILQRENEHELVLQAPRTGSVVVGSLAALVSLMVWWMFPGHRIAQGVFFLLAVAGLSGLLQVHRLRLDLDARRWQYRDGWIWRPPRAEGSFDDLACVAVERYGPDDGLVASRLRSRRVVLYFERFDVAGHDGRFPLGFPMGPNLAPERARQLADRLGIGSEDRVVERG